MATERGLRFCSGCGAEVGRGAHYCLSCGTPLDTVVGVSCPACQTNNPDRARFCLSCGACLASVAEADRRVVTVVFADLSGFTQLTEQLDPEEVRELVVSCLNLLSDCILRWGGHVDKFIGDCVMGLFGAPVAYENEEERAIRAALDMQAALSQWSVEDVIKSGDLGEYRPRVRIGINSGPVVAGLFAAGGARDYTVIGDTVNVASRLQGLSEPGRILVGPMTYEQTRHLFEFEEERRLEVRGRREPVAARHVIGVRAQRGKARGFSDRRIPMVGRESELVQLRELWRRASEGDFRACLIAGQAGIGKTRLVEELRDKEKIAAQDVASGRSYPHASGAPWEPIADLVRSLFSLPGDLHPTEAALRIAHASDDPWPSEELAALRVLLGSPIAEAAELQHYGMAERRDRIGDAVVRSLRAATDTPRLLILEDLHWADSSTLEFLCSLPELDLHGSALAVLVSRPPLPGESLVARLFESVPDQLELRPLNDADVRAFIQATLGDHELPGEFIDVIVERAEGNPLFIEETLKSLTESGALVRERGVWRASGDIAEIEVPDTIESVLTTRIDGLDGPSRQVLQLASVVGRRFWSGVLADALAGRSIERELTDLQRSTLIRALPFSTVSGNREFMFEHLLLQEVAYEGMLRGARTELHGAVARWFEEQPGSQRGEYDELIAYHRERSDDPESAIPFLHRAAQAARGRGALLDARALIDRALRLAKQEDQAASLLLVSEDVAAEMGDVERRTEAVERLEAIAEAGEDPRIAAEAAYRRARLLRDSGDLKAAWSKCERALELYTNLEDISCQGDALRLLGRIAHLWGDFPQALRFYRSSLPLERKAGDHQGQAEIFDLLGLAQVDLGGYTTALDYFEAALDLASEGGNRPLQARVGGHRASALASLGRYDEATESARTAAQLARLCGSRHIEAGSQISLAYALAGKGDTAAAAEVADRVRQLASDLKQPRLLARALLLAAQTGNRQPSRETIRQARQLAEENGLTHVEILARVHEAELDLEAGNLAEADRTSAEAMEALDLHGSIEGPEEAVLFCRARVLAALDRGDESNEALQRARTIVRNRAERIEDPQMRRGYLEDVVLNREIMAHEGTAQGETT
ncbi:MAG: AAA family ATPase [Gemmatimonadetes bacterium]|nr:AAA family ATPase [Gemmatimonadota bacterium]